MKRLPDIEYHREEIEAVFHEAGKVSAYWKKRCEAAEKVIKSSDYYDAMGAKSEWKAIVSLEKEFVK